MRRRACLVLLLVVAPACGASSSTQEDASVADAPLMDAALEDRRWPRPDAPAVAGFTVTVDGVVWYVLSGSVSSWSSQDLAYIDAILSCDECYDTAHLLIALKSPATDACGPTANNLDFTRLNLSQHPYRAATGDSCGFQVSEAGDETGRLTGSFHSDIYNIDTSLTTPIALSVDFDLFVGTTFP